MSEFDEETLRLVRTYVGDPTTPIMFSEEVLCERSGCWTLAEFVALINEAVAKIPLAARADATVELDGGYDESTRLIINYTRQETPEEMAARMARGLKYASDVRAKERATFDALKRKFGE